MTFILRWPAILVLLLLVLASFGAAFAGTVHLAQLPIALPVTAEQQATIDQLSWIEVGLWAGAGMFFLIAAVRLIRRTQAFWTWLIGFALFGARWAIAQQNEGGGLVANVQSINVNAYTAPAELAANSGGTEAQVGILGVILIIGLLVFIVDAADRSYWDKQGA
ncbi:hypothetical protein [Candidatus Viadribacter manganicus]|uniref:Uncharacterized protein n=1 Tax=Candidatus Viadribacter manganicus TaxID=1759059 RepID=A0A1B1AI21_9PROT|nr:hypothetical protein [Candidatus Viadribacter manganicus]ANP46216.1 hypothetical protein ATE48_09945 [Candidatus Viadribacter manganicus]